MAQDCHRRPPPRGPFEVHVESPDELVWVEHVQTWDDVQVIVAEAFAGDEPYPAVTIYGQDGLMWEARRKT